MTILQKLAMRQLKLNKKRTLVTILGVIISSAMLTATVTGIFSGMDYMRRSKITEEGEWHVRYNDLTAGQVPGLSTKEGDKVYVTSDLGYAKLKKPRMTQRPYLLISSLDANALSTLPMKLLSGRLPQNAGELVVSQELLNGMADPPKVGDTVTYDIGKRIDTQTNKELTTFTPLQRVKGSTVETLKTQQKNTYRIVGVVSPPAMRSSPAAYVAFTKMEAGELPPNTQVEVSVIKKDVTNALYKEARANCKKLGCASQPNSLLLATYLVGTEAVMAFSGICAVLFGLILIAGVSLIANAFSITAAESTKQLGMLASFGATRKQKFRVLLMEGGFIGVVGIPLGVASGVLGIWVTFQLVNRFYLEEGVLFSLQLKTIVNPWSILLCALLGIVTIFISVFRPALSAARVSPIEALRQTKAVRVKPRALRTPRLVRKALGMEGDLALKNLRRNGWRSRTTLFSMVLSIVLFIGVFGFTSYASKMLGATMETTDYDIRVSSYTDSSVMPGEAGKELNRLESDFLSVPSASSIRTERTTSVNCRLPLDAFTTQYRKFAASKDGKDSGGVWMELKAIGAEEMAQKLKEAGLTKEQLEKTGGIPALISNTTPNPENPKYNLEILKFRQGKTITPTLVHRTEEGIYGGAPLNIIGTVKNSQDSTHGAIYISLDDMGKLDPKIQQELQDSRSFYYKTDDPNKTQEELQSIIETSSQRLYLRNVARENQQSSQLIAIVNIFSIGFITLMTMVSLANLFNMISTSISLRRKEFAMLKSVGITPRSFRRMIHLESFLYAVYALVWGLPIGVLLNLLVYKIAVKGVEFPFYLPWVAYLCTVGAVLLIVGGLMTYSTRKVKKEPVMEALRDDTV